MSEIFKSRITQKFRSQDIENAYQEMRSQSIRKYNIIYSLINLFFLTMNSMIYCFTFTQLKSNLYLYLKMTSFALIAIQLVLLFLSIFCRRFKWHRWISYVNVCTINLSNLAARIYLGIFAQVDYFVFSLVYIIQQVYSLFWYFTNSLDFFDGFFVYLIAQVISYIYYSAEYPVQFHFRFALNTIIVMVSIFLSYFYIQEKKKSFYYNFMNEITIKSNSSIIQNMNSGFIRIVNSKIAKINKILYSHVRKIQNNREESNGEINININNISLNENLNLKPDNYHHYFDNLTESETCFLLEDLFSNLLLDHHINSETNITHYQRAKDFLKTHQCSDSKINENFIFLGTKEFKNATGESSYYEIFGRYSSIFNADKEEKFEFLFNDVSKTKISERINAENKCKSIFLSKVAHEFKNPLICVSELVDQLNEQLESVITHSFNHHADSRKIKENLATIKSINEYMLLLVKDLDFFSLQQPGSTNKIKLEKENVSVDQVVSYCDNITNVLLKKYQKEDSIKFSIDCKKEIGKTEIFTDELRVKQLLINLLSNSVKYTHNGEITLQITDDKEKIKFKVKDTGKGLSEEEKIKLKSNCVQSRVIGANSSGLGFSIIREIIDLFGSQLEYEEGEFNGSIFSFSIEKSPSINHGISQRNSSSLLDNSFVSNASTVVKAFSHRNEPEIMRNLIERLEKNTAQTSIDILKIDETPSKLLLDSNADYIIVVDDEQITRKSTIRIMQKHFSTKNENKRSKVIIEASDGIECLYVFYQCIKKGIRLSYIISDMTMEFMDGGYCAKILKDVTQNKKLKPVPFVILSAYENMEFDNSSGVYKYFTKPWSMKNIEEIDYYFK